MAFMNFIIRQHDGQKLQKHGPFSLLGGMPSPNPTKLGIVVEEVHTILGREKR